jgi:hypothetical protein
MRKQLKLPFRLNLVRHPGQTVLNIRLEPRAHPELCLGLCLLREGLISVLLLQEEWAKGKIEIQLATRTGHHTRTQASFEKDATRVKMTPDDLDFVLHFFLKYFRDGVAEVDHLDLDVESQLNGQDSTITFKVSDSLQPMSAEEAKERLGLE